MNRSHYLALLGFLGAALIAFPVVAADSADSKDGDQDKNEIKSKTVLLNEGTHVGWLTMRGALRDGPAPMTIYGIQGSAKGTLRGVMTQLKNIAEDDKYKGVMIHLDGAGVNLAQIDELQRAFKKIQANKKRVMIFAETYNTLTYRLACSADKILMIQNGGVELAGLSVEEMYMAGLLEKVGVKADMIQVGQYKGADEQFSRTGPSMAWNENIDSLMDDLYSIIIDGIVKSRGSRKGFTEHLGSRKKLEKLMRDTLLMTDKQLLKRGVIDYVVTRQLKNVYHKPSKNDEGKDTPKDIAELVFDTHRFEWDEDMGLKTPVLQLGNPMIMFQQMLAPTAPKITRPTIAVIHCNGVIQSGDSGGPTLFGGGESIGSRTIVEELRDAMDNSLIKAVIIRIDSPGGSALASEVIWQGVRSVIEGGDDAKPVYISVGSMAASGGYYIACAGDKIYAAPNSIIGSIGVVGGKMTMGGLYKWAGIGIHRRSRGPLGDMFNGVEPFTKEQRVWMHKALSQVYTQFTDRVKAGRGNKIKKIEDVAQGRLFTGRQCIKNGMIDKIGGLEIVIQDLAKKVKLDAGQYDIIDLPEQPSFPEMLEQMMSVIQSPSSPAGLNAQQAAVIQSARVLIGDQHWQQAAAVMNGMMLLRKERALTLMPVVIKIK
jgi:protease-4